MGLTKITEKLDSYFGRLENGKATKIKPSHVEKVIAKLRAKQMLLKEEIDGSEKASKKERLEKKLTTLGQQIERAKWLLGQIGAKPKH